MILPYIEQDNLYKQFKLDEPWDSEHNKKLIDKMPKVYALPNNLSKPGLTHYRVFVGNGAIWDWIQGDQDCSGDRRLIEHPPGRRGRGRRAVDQTG